MAHHPGLGREKTGEGQRAFLGTAIRLDHFAQSPALNTFRLNLNPSAFVVFLLLICF